MTQYGKYYGLYSRVARTLGVSPSHVRKVDLGLHKSQRVADALHLEMERFDRARKKGRKATVAGEAA